MTGEQTEATVEAGSDPSDLTPETADGSDPTGLIPDENALTQLAAERDEYLADLQRLAAEFDNYRKRAARDRERLVAHAHERLVRELLPVLDDLERALEAAAKPPIRATETDRGNREVPPTDTEEDEYSSLVDGVKLVEQSLRKALVKEGLVEIDTDGAFDPHVHEALLARPHDEAESGAVLEVVQRGYRLGDKVVRPAKVIVAE